MACALYLALALAPARAGGPCAPMNFDGAGYVVCAFDVRRDDIRLYLADAGRKPYGNFTALARRLKAHGRMLRFAMNAGMYRRRPLAGRPLCRGRQAPASRRHCARARAISTEAERRVLDRRQESPASSRPRAISPTRPPRATRRNPGPMLVDRRPHPSQDPADRRIREGAQRRLRARGQQRRVRDLRRRGDVPRLRAPVQGRARIARTRCSSTAPCPRSTRPNSTATTNWCRWGRWSA